MENSGMIVERTMNLSALGGKNKGGLIGVPQSPGRLLQVLARKAVPLT